MSLILISTDDLRHINRPIYLFFAQNISLLTKYLNFMEVKVLVRQQRNYIHEAGFKTLFRCRFLCCLKVQTYNFSLGTKLGY